MYDVEIDQSGRTDVLTVDTALALSDGVQRAILIPKSVKRECHARLRARGMRKALIGIRLFSAGLVLLLEECIHSIAFVTIDVEYVGWEGESPAHELAWRTLRGDRIPERYVGVEELMGAC